MKTRGIRNNNPFNIRLSNYNDWMGEEKPSRDNEFETFSAPIFGLRAGAVLLKNYYNNYKLVTVRQIITRFAPPTENDTEAYITSVSHALNVNSNQALNLSNPKNLIILMKAIVKHENGYNPYSDTTYLEAIELSNVQGTYLPFTPPDDHDPEEKFRNFIEKILQWLKNLVKSI